MKPVHAEWERTKCRSACTFMQSDQLFFFSFFFASVIQYSLLLYPKSVEQMRVIWRRDNLVISPSKYTLCVTEAILMSTHNQGYRKPIFCGFKPIFSL